MTCGGAFTFSFSASCRLSKTRVGGALTINFARTGGAFTGSASDGTSGSSGGGSDLAGVERAFGTGRTGGALECGPFEAQGSAPLAHGSPRASGGASGGATAPPRGGGASCTGVRVPDLGADFGASFGAALVADFGAGSSACAGTAKWSMPVATAASAASRSNLACRSWKRCRSASRIRRSCSSLSLSLCTSASSASRESRSAFAAKLCTCTSLTSFEYEILRLAMHVMIPLHSPSSSASTWSSSASKPVTVIVYGPIEA
mmetsp:Transcript_52600/g.140178  ORF Transcript_52600/g.140178 Transcript_52600/m.140178 type:complete len:260 (-) Transcript_52600:45-824(-)